MVVFLEVGWRWRGKRHASPDDFNILVLITILEFIFVSVKISDRLVSSSVEGVRSIVESDWTFRRTQITYLVCCFFWGGVFKVASTSRSLVTTIGFNVIVTVKIIWYGDGRGVWKDEHKYNHCWGGTWTRDPSSEIATTLLPTAISAHRGLAILYVVYAFWNCSIMLVQPTWRLTFELSSGKGHMVK